MLDLAAEGIPIALTCRVLEFFKQAFHAGKANPVSQRNWDDAHLINAAYDLHADYSQFGHRFIADGLEREYVSGANTNRVQRLWSPQRIAARIGRRKGSEKRPGPAADDDLVEWDSSASE